MTVSRPQYDSSGTPFWDTVWDTVLGHAWDPSGTPYWGMPGTRLDIGYTMGWALAIPMHAWEAIPRYHTPGTPPHTHPCYSGLSVDYTPAQRYRLSVKTAFTGSPIYRQTDKRAKRVQRRAHTGSRTCQNVPSFLIQR